MKYIKYGLLVLGITAVAWLVYDVGYSKIVQNLQQLGWVGICFVLPYLVVYTTDTFGWQWSFSNEMRLCLPSFWKMVKIKLAGEAINYTLPGGYIGGEPLKAFLLTKQDIPLSHGFASVLIGKFLMTLAEVAFIFIGLNLAFLSLENKIGIGLALGGLFVFAMILLAFLKLQKKGLAVFFAKLLSKMQIAPKWFQAHTDNIQKFDTVLAEYYTQKRNIIVGIVCFFLGWCFGASEIYIFLRLMGQSIPIYQIFVLEALFVTIKGMGTVVPGSVGIQEGGIAGTFAMFHFDPALGLTFGILRRTREIFWIIIGLIFLQWEWDKKIVDKCKSDSTEIDKKAC